MDKVLIPWGSEELEFEIPSGFKLIKIAEHEVTNHPHQWQMRMAELLSQATSGPALTDLLHDLDENGKIAIVMEDLTRNSPLDEILEIIMAEIRHADIRDDQIKFVSACGMHPHADEKDYRARLCEGTENIPIRLNPWHDPSEYTNLGRAGKFDILIDKEVVNADIRILISHTSPHLQAGFGGGYKMFLPGCAEIKTIRMLHRLGISYGGLRQMVGTDPDSNKMRMMTDQAGKMIDEAHGTTFSVQFMLDEDNSPSHIASGTTLPVHRMLTKKCAIEHGIVTEEPGDVLIANAYPRDFDLWQMFKSIPNTCWAARPGGIVICIGKCEKGLNEMKQVYWPVSPKWTQKLVRFFGPDNITSILDRLVSGIAGDSQWFIRLATNILNRNTLYLVSPTLAGEHVKFPGVEIFGDIDEAFAAAKKELGKGTHRVVVYPHGGASYPIMQGRHKD